MAKRYIKTMLYWEHGERGIVMEKKKGTQQNYDMKFSEKRNLHSTQRGVSKKKTRHKAPEEFSQWKAPEDTFDIQQFMQEIM